MDADAITAFLTQGFPSWDENPTHVHDVSDESVQLRHEIGPDDLRPGQTVSGPILMGLADTAMYVALLSRIGPVAMAYTTNLSINFLRPALPSVLIARCRLLKLGKRLAVGDVHLFNEGSDTLVAQATVTYSIPPR